MALIITKAGLEKAIDASLQGISFKITHVGVGSDGYVPEVNQKALRNEVERLAISGGKKISSNQIHLTALFDGNDEIIGREVGFYLEDGTLFAVDSDPSAIIMYKSGSNGSRALEAFDLILDSVPADSITVDVTGDLTLNFDKDFEEIKQFTLDKLTNYSPTLKTQYVPWDATRAYKTGEVCTIEVGGEVIAMQMYAGPNITCINKNPADLANRQDGWTNNKAPFWWVPYKSARPGTALWPWMSQTIPEGTLNVLGNSVPVSVFWRLALAIPEFVNKNTGMIDFPETRGEFFRVLDQGRGVNFGRLFNSSEKDELKKHTHEYKSSNTSSYSSYVNANTDRYTVEGTGLVSTATGGSETRPRNLAFPILIEI